MRLFCHGLIQVAVGLAHVQRGNYRGAVALLARGLEKLERCPERCQGLDVASFVEAVRQCRETLLALGPGGVARFPWDQAPKILSAD